MFFLTKNTTSTTGETSLWIKDWLEGHYGMLGNFLYAMTNAIGCLAIEARSRLNLN